MNSILSILWQVLKWIGIGGGLALLGLTALTDPADLPPSTWNGPVFVKDHWELTGIVQHGIQTHRLFEQELDLVEVRFGQGSLWALAGVKDRNGAYESLVKGITSRQDIQTAFRQPRYITLSIPGTLKAVDHRACMGRKMPFVRLQGW